MRGQKALKRSENIVRDDGLPCASSRRGKCWASVGGLLFASHLPSRAAKSSLRQSQKCPPFTGLGETSGVESRVLLWKGAKRDVSCVVDLHLQVQYRTRSVWFDTQIDSLAFRSHVPLFLPFGCFGQHRKCNGASAAANGGTRLHRMNFSNNGPAPLFP